jgi:hypothetical protein
VALTEFRWWCWRSLRGTDQADPRKVDLRPALNLPFQQFELYLPFHLPYEQNVAIAARTAKAFLFCGFQCL